MYNGYAQTLATYSSVLEVDVRILLVAHLVIGFIYWVWRFLACHDPGVPHSEAHKESNATSLLSPLPASIMILVSGFSSCKNLYTNSGNDNCWHVNKNAETLAVFEVSWHCVLCFSCYLAILEVRCAAARGNKESDQRRCYHILFLNWRTIILMFLFLGA